MNSKLYIYRFSFVANILACLTFVGFILYSFTIKKGRLEKYDILGLILLGIFLIIYLLADLAGLNLLKKLKLHEALSGRRIFAISTVFILQAALQLLLAYGIYSEASNIITVSGRISAGEFYPVLLFLETLLLVIFLSATYNLFSIVQLIKKVRVGHQQFNDMIQEIGSFN